MLVDDEERLDPTKVAAHIRQAGVVQGVALGTSRMSDAEEAVAAALLPDINMTLKIDALTQGIERGSGLVRQAERRREIPS